MRTPVITTKSFGSGRVKESRDDRVLSTGRRKFDCLVIGDIIFDVFLGQLEANASLQRNGTSYCDSAKIEFGGAGNVAAALSSLGANVSFIGKAGDDLWGRLYETDLLERDITTAISYEKRTLTGLAFVSLSHTGERSFRVFRGANDRLSVKDIDKSLNLFENSEYMYFSGYSLVADPQKTAIYHAVRLAKKYGVKIFFDPGAHNLIKTDFELFKKLLDVCDVVCPNIEEAKAITRSAKLDDAILRLQKTSKLICLKCGQDGCILIHNKDCVKIPGFKVKCVDTTGAGDAFAAALIYGLVYDLSLNSTGSLANWFAAQVTTGIGARNLPANYEVFEFKKSLENATCDQIACALNRKKRNAYANKPKNRAQDITH